MKNGQSVPGPLSSALSDNEYAAKVSRKCAYQSWYAGHIDEATSGGMKIRRALSAIEQICKYGERHNI